MTHVGMQGELSGHKSYVLVGDNLGLRVADVLDKLILCLNTEKVYAMVKRLHYHARVVELALQHTNTHNLANSWC